MGRPLPSRNSAEKRKGRLKWAPALWHSLHDYAHTLCGRRVKCDATGTMDRKTTVRRTRDLRGT